VGELPAVVDMEEALAGKTVIHPELGDNVCFKREHDTGGVDEAFAQADVVVEETYHFGRHTGVCLEGRAILADYNAAEHSLTVYHATQAPHMMQDIFSRHLNIPEGNVRVIAKDVGGSFGIKVHVYADEMATAALSVMLRRPGQVRRRPARIVRLRHPRPRAQGEGAPRVHQGRGDPRVRPRTISRRSARIRCTREPSGIEGNQVVNLTGGPVQAPEVPRADECRLHQQERHVPVPGGRASDRGGADRMHRRSRRRRVEDRSGRIQAAQPDSGRRLSVHLSVRNQVRKALASPDIGEAAGPDGL
jgi:hypothetical protein